jgi:hypothetical protein
LVRVKLALSAPLDAVTVEVPPYRFAVAVTEHNPFASVVQVRGEIAAPAPETGELNPTTAPATGRLLASRTLTCSGVAKAVPTCALWPLPAVAVIVAGLGLKFVRVKLVKIVLCPMDALTL